jgi:transcriptional regulator GlxA family with amidase domain
VILLVLGFVAGYGGVVVAEAPSVPGEPLYAIERKAETLWLSLTPNARRCEVELVLLERRVYEVSALLDAGQSAPDELWQEIDLLFLGVADGAHCRPEEAAELLPHLLAYRNRLKALAGRHPGVWSLAQTLETADAVVATLQAEAAP